MKVTFVSSNCLESSTQFTHIFYRALRKEEFYELSSLSPFLKHSKLEKRSKSPIFLNEESTQKMKVTFVSSNCLESSTQFTHIFYRALCKEEFYELSSLSPFLKQIINVDLSLLFT